MSINLIGTSEVYNYLATDLRLFIDDNNTKIKILDKSNFIANIMFKDSTNIIISTRKEGNKFIYKLNNKDYDREQLLVKLGEIKQKYIDMFVDIDNPNNYHKCMKTVYKIWGCKPPKGTMIINRLFDSLLIKQLGINPQYPVITKEMFQKLKQDKNKVNLINYGLRTNKIFVVEEDDFVLYGTIGEMWSIKKPKLIKTYNILYRNSPQEITEENLAQFSEKNKSEFLMPWVQLQTKEDNSIAMACFIPKEQTNVKFMAYGNTTELLANDTSISNHGKGDFILCYANSDGTPNMNDRWLLNGLIFATTYNLKKGYDWSKYVIDSSKGLVLNKPKELYNAGVILQNNTEKLDFIERILINLVNTAPREMPFTYVRQADKILVKSKVIKDYVKKNTEDETNKFKSFISTISLVGDKIEFKSYNVYQNSKKLVYQFYLPNTEIGFRLLQQKALIYFGFIGYIKGDIQSSFSANTPNKFEYDGIESYTISSSGLARKLRFQERDYEHSGAEAQRLLRCIQGMDSYFDKFEIKKPIYVFRGMPLSDAKKIAGVTSFEQLKGKVITNTAYTSTSVNLQSTLMFAKPPTVSESDAGLVMCIQLPVGIHADYIHNIAGWEEQFEVLLDRKYDIQIEDIITTITDANSFKYYVVNANLVQHQPFEKIPSFALSCLSNNKFYLDTEKESCMYYDNNGRLNFSFDIIKSAIMSAFNLLRQKGLTNIQIQKNASIGNKTLDFIVLRGNKNKDNTFIDTAFTVFSEEPNILQVYKIKGTDDSIRNYWSDRNRNSGTIDRNFSWETYNFDSNKAILEYKESLPLVGDTIEINIANAILKYSQFSTDSMLYPLQDICRYFDVIMKQVILTEGYLLKNTSPVNRIGSVNNEEDGYVQIKYLIDGDDDDSLLLDFKFRKKNKQLQCQYKGRTKNLSINEIKGLSWDIFNQDIMLKTCMDILDDFAKRLNLNHTRRVEKFMTYVMHTKGITVHRVPIKVQTKNIHDKGFYDSYEIYANKQIHIEVIVGKGTDRNMYFTMLDKNGNTHTYTSIKQATIVQLYKDFCYNMKIFDIL